MGKLLEQRLALSEERPESSEIEEQRESNARQERADFSVEIAAQGLRCASQRAPASHLDASKRQAEMFRGPTAQGKYRRSPAFLAHDNAHEPPRLQSPASGPEQRADARQLRRCMA